MFTQIKQFKNNYLYSIWKFTIYLKVKKVYKYISLYKRSIAVLLSYFIASCKKTVINFYVNTFPALFTSAIFLTNSDNNFSQNFYMNCNIFQKY